MVSEFSGSVKAPVTSYRWIFFMHPFIFGWSYMSFTLGKVKADYKNSYKAPIYTRGNVAGENPCNL